MKKVAEVEFKPRPFLCVIFGHDYKYNHRQGYLYYFHCKRCTARKVDSQDGEGLLVDFEWLSRTSMEKLEE